MDLARDLKISVMETNIREGKKNMLRAIKAKEDLDKKIVMLKQPVDNLRGLPDRSFVKNVKRFFVCCSECGLKQTIKKTVNYLNYHSLLPGGK